MINDQTHLLLLLAGWLVYAARSKMRLRSKEVEAVRNNGFHAVSADVNSSHVH